MVGINKSSFCSLDITQLPLASVRDHNISLCVQDEGVINWFDILIYLLSELFSCDQNNYGVNHK